MSLLRPEIDGFSIVLTGQFNPQIYQPIWFASEGIVRRGEADDAKIDLIHPSLARFSMGNFLLQATSDRFSISTTDPPSHEPVRDVVVSTFRILRHTPIGKMGINRYFHYRVESEGKWHALGHRLAPKEPWTGILERPGMISLTMQGVRADPSGGYINVRVEPSSRCHPGVFIHVNDHYEIVTGEDANSAVKAVDILTTQFSASLKRAAEIANKIIGDL